MSKLEEGLNKKFGRLMVKEIIKEKGKPAKYRCECDCGKEIITQYTNLHIGKTMSCGCLGDEVRRRKNKPNHYLKHGLSGSRLSVIRNGMISRCYNTNSDSYRNYGGRGITICEEWLNKETGMLNFYNWAINNGYRDDLSIDRIDNDKGYFPENCRWVGVTDQAKNKRPYLRHKFDKKTALFNKEMVETLKKLGFSHITIRNRIKKYRITILEAVKMKNIASREIHNEYLPEYLDKTNIISVREETINKLKTLLTD